MQKIFFITLKIFVLLSSLTYACTVFCRIEGIRDAMVVNNRAYVVNAWQGVDIINISEPSNSSIVGHVSISNPISVKVVGEYAYIAGGISIKNPMDVRVIEEAEYVNGGLYIVNISNPNNPYIVGQTNTTLGLPYGIDVVGNYAYITEIELPSRGYTAGLTIYDISNKTSPTIVGHIATHNPTGVKVVDNYAYVADQPEGLKIINIANPSSPILVGNITTSCAVKVDIVGNYAYVADDTAGVKIFNIANPEFPVLIGNITTNNARDIKIIDNYALVADYTAGVKIFDVSNPQDPVLVKRVDAAESQGITVAGNYVYSAAGTLGLIKTIIPLPGFSSSSTTMSSSQSSLDVFSVTSFIKNGHINADIEFTALDFLDNFKDKIERTLVKVKIITLPTNGILKLAGNTVTIGQEIHVRELGDLIFTPNIDWSGVTSFAWNGNDGVSYALNPATVTIDIGGGVVSSATSIKPFGFRW